MTEIVPEVDFGDITSISNFYEILTAGIVGGKWVGGVSAKLKPDVTTSTKIIEVKYASRNNAFRIKSSQLKRYLIQQCSNFFVNPQKEIYFYLYKSNLNSSAKLFRDYHSVEKLEKIVETFSKETGFLLMAPFSVMYKVFTEDSSENPLQNFKSEYDYPRGYNRGLHLIKFKARGIKELLLHPRKFLELYQLDPEDFIIIQTNFPSEMKINTSKAEYPINPFPILKIEDKNHEDWLAEFNRNHLDEINEIIHNGQPSLFSNLDDEDDFL